MNTQQLTPAAVSNMPIRTDYITLRELAAQELDEWTRSENHAVVHEALECLLAKIVHAQGKPIATSERRPTLADADCNGKVWWWSGFFKGWRLGGWNSEYLVECPFWLHTGLQIPAAPREVSHDG